jgi:hypothetical protein
MAGEASSTARAHGRDPPELPETVAPATAPGGGALLRDTRRPCRRSPGAKRFRKDRSACPRVSICRIYLIARLGSRTGENSDANGLRTSPAGNRAAENGTKNKKGERLPLPFSSLAPIPLYQVIRAYFSPSILVSGHAASVANCAPAGTAPAYPARVPFASWETARYVHPGWMDWVCRALEPAS